MEDKPWPWGGCTPWKCTTVHVDTQVPSLHKSTFTWIHTFKLTEQFSRTMISTGDRWYHGKSILKTISSNNTNCLTSEQYTTVYRMLVEVPVLKVSVEQSIFLNTLSIDVMQSHPLWMHTLLFNCGRSRCVYSMSGFRGWRRESLACETMRSHSAPWAWPADDVVVRGARAIPRHGHVSWSCGCQFSETKFKSQVGKSIGSEYVVYIVS